MPQTQRVDRGTGRGHVWLVEPCPWGKIIMHTRTGARRLCLLVAAMLFFGLLQPAVAQDPESTGDAIEPGVGRDALRLRHLP
jgi:hypothetical protein